MYFTREDLEKIRKYIAQQGVKDSEFEAQKELHGDEWFTIVGPSGNKKIKATTLLNIFMGTGGEFLENGIQTVETLEDLDKFATKIYGNFVYVRSEDGYYSYSKTEQWQEILKVYIGSEEPVDQSVLWIDPTDDSTLDADEDEEIKKLKKELQVINIKLEALDRLITVGIVPGDVTKSYRRQLMETAEPEKPEGVPEDESESEVMLLAEGEEDVEEDDSADKPDTTYAEPTVNHNCVKADTSINFSKNRQDLVDREMLFYTDKKRFAIYYEGKFYTISSNNDAAGGGGGGLSVEDLYTLALDYLIFNDGKRQYKVKLDSNGKWAITAYSSETTLPGSPSASWGNYISHLLSLNSVFCGGDGSEEALCSHNFVELANGSKEDINLKGIYLLYTDGTKASASDIGYTWEVLELEGIIKAGSTFVIRGAQCNTPKACLINVDSYDMEWKIGNDLIKFKQGPSSFYLCAGNSFQELLDSRSLNNPWAKQTTKVGYIDSCGFGTGSVGEGSKTFLVESDWNKVLFVRWFMLEPAKQGNKAYASRNTTDLWTYIDLEKQTTKEGNSLQYYYPDYIKQRYAPKASYLEKTFFTIKTKFEETKPNMLNITFGMQATDNGSGATRCFNWVSVGYYEEYIEWRKIGETKWNRQLSYVPNDPNNDENINKFINYYKRLRWCASDGTWVTTHKTIIKGLTKGEYEYRVGRENDSSYTSDTLNFTVHSDEDVTNFSFIQTSDQQGFNWAEYTAWKKAAYMIKKSETDYNFTINTGDATQSGNRPSEWLDYYEGRQYIRDKEEMYSIGNNDLCGYVSTDLTDGEDATSKYNHINVLRYFTFELDPRNEYEVEWQGEKYPLYSLYSFNYGAYHFISLNSEIAIASSKMYKDWQDGTYPGDSTFAEAANAQVEAWLEKDLQLWSGKENPTDCSKCIVYMHEMPFTIVTYGFMGGAAARAGSKLNTLNANGQYRFSRIFKKRGIRLVMGGHKHTYCITKPIYDAPENYISSNAIRPSADLMDVVTDEMSRKPVIQVTRDADIQNNSKYARYEKVSKVNAPTYVMSQATGYKLVSNKEQPSDDTYIIPWLLAYFKQPKGTGKGTTENVAQHRPMYIKYDLSNDAIKVTANQVHNIWNVNVDKNTKSFDMNKQLSELSVEAMTLETTSDADKAAYGIKEIESYTINL